MGVNGLWRVVREAQPRPRTESLEAIARTAFVKDEKEFGGLRIGIDSSIWLCQLRTGTDQARLELLFHHVLSLLSIPVLPLFVFDGPCRPAFKRQRTISIHRLHLEKVLYELIDACGFEITEGLGEAEVELAKAFEQDLIDQIVSDDGDVLVFGDTHLIRNPKSADFCNLQICPTTWPRKSFTISDLEAFTPSQRIFVALYAGGDYSFGVFPEQDDRLLWTEADRRALDAYHIATFELENGRLAELLVAELKTATAAPESEMELLQRYLLLDWIPILQQATKSLKIDTTNLDLEKLFDSQILSLYLNPVAWPKSRRSENRPRWLMKPNLADLARFAEQNLAPASSCDHTTLQRRRELVVAGILASQLRHKILAAGAGRHTDPRLPFTHLVTPLAAAAKPHDAGLVVAVDATKALEIWEPSPTASLANNTVIVHLSAAYAPAIADDVLNGTNHQELRALVQAMCRKDSKAPVSQRAGATKRKNPFVVRTGVAETLQKRARLPLGPGQPLKQTTLNMSAVRPKARVQATIAKGKRNNNIEAIDLCSDE